MALREPIRSSIHQRFDELFSTEEAHALMAQFPATDEGELLTREYLDLRLDARFSVVDGRFAKVEAEFANVRSELKVEFAKVDAEFAKVRGEIAGVALTLHRDMVSQTRWMVGSIATFGGLAVGAARLFGG